MKNNELYIKAINPGYTINKKSNVGEFIELARPTTDTPLSLAGLTIGYTNSSGNTINLLVFPEDSWLTGESILLRLASSPESELAHLSYLKTIAMSAGPLELIYDGTVIDSVCWTGKDGCYNGFDSSHPTTLVRNGDIFEHIESYEPNYLVESFEIIAPSPPPEPTPHCTGLQFSEIFTNYEVDASEQFVELYNSTSDPIDLTGCQIKYKNNFYDLTGTVAPQNFYIYRPQNFTFTKNPTTNQLIEIIDSFTFNIDSLTYNSQKHRTSYAKFSEIWKSTYNKTPGAANVYQEFQTCEEGKMINEETGNCIKIPNTSTPKTCDEGYELNLETNRCRKIRINEGTEYPIVTDEAYIEETNFVPLLAVIIMFLAGVAYTIFQFRTELKKLFSKLRKSFDKAHRSLREKLRRAFGRHEPQ